MLGTRTEFGKEKACIEIIKMFELFIIEEKSELRSPEDWRTPMITQLTSGEGAMGIADLS